MADAQKLVRIAGGATAALAAAIACGTLEASAKPAKRNRGGILTAQTATVAWKKNVPLNEIVEVEFSQNIDPASVGPATFQIRALNSVSDPSNGAGYTKQVFGSYQVAGNVVRFYPRLPGHLRDANGQFWPEGHANDDALENAGLQPSSNYQLLVIGRPNATTIRSSTGRPLRNSQFTRFSTQTSSDPGLLFTTSSYSDQPPPQYSFSNPTDTVPSVATNYAIRGGTKGVPNDIQIQLYCSRVPIAPGTARIPDSVTLRMTERYGNPALARPVRSTVFVEQNYETTLLVVKPKFPLSDRGQYALRVTKNVKDLTEQYDFMANRERERLRAIYDHLATERASRPPGSDPALFQDPEPALIGDWPDDLTAAEKGVLKANILALGDAYPIEMDPRVMLLFTSRDEPVSTAEFRVEFTKSENLLDAGLSTGEWDQTVPGTASAIFTASAGTGVNGDFAPTGNITLPSASLPGPVYNFRSVNIPAGVTVRLTGSQPIQIRAINFTLNGTLDGSGADGAQGVAVTSVSTTNPTQPATGGSGGPGAGAGGSGQSSLLLGRLNDWWYGGGGTGVPGTHGPYRSPSGRAGVDTEGNNPTAVGGQGGQGGSAATGSASGYTYSYGYAGGGGGGGGAGQGNPGRGGNWTGSPYSAWNGSGGAGGAAAAVTDLNPFFGGAGGGSSGIGGFNPDYSTTVTSNGWVSGGSSGGGGGGAVLVQTAKSLTIGSTGMIVVRGGAGGAARNVNYGETGGGGGGSGGSILLRTTGTFNIASPNASLVVAGGLGGVGGSYSGAGGSGSVGFVRVEDPNGGAGIAIPGLSGSPVYGSQGTFDPTGGGLPSYVYSKWTDLGVDDPRILPWTINDVATFPTTNDGILVQVQMTREHPTLFGTPDVSRINGVQDSTNTTYTSQWQSIKVHDRTGIQGGAFGPVPGYDLGANGTEYAGFDPQALNGKGYRFIRFRIFFQLDQTQQYSDPLPYVDFIATRYQFNL